MAINKKLLYIILVSTVVVAILLIQGVNQYYLSKIQNQARVVNYAGRQRMLSQQFAKNVLLMDSSKNFALSKDLENWYNMHLSLRNGNDSLNITAQSTPLILEQFDRIEPIIHSIITSFNEYISSQIPYDHLLKTVLHNESRFLQLMDELVFAIDGESEKNVKKLAYIEITLTATSLLILWFEYLLLLRPSFRIIASQEKLLIENFEEQKGLNKELVRITEQLNTHIKNTKNLSYSMAHDLKAPLRSIIGYTSILKEEMAEMSNEEMNGFYNKIMRNARHGTELVEDILSYSKFNTIELQKTETDVASLIQEVVKKIDSSHQFMIDLEGCPKLDLDQRMMSQVFDNIIQNAIKYSYTDQTKPIEIFYQEEDDTVVVSVRDYGIGFKQEYHDRLFEVFYRNDQKTSGSGIGLAVVKTIMEKHGGSVSAESELEKGATFSVTIPKQTNHSAFESIY